MKIAALLAPSLIVALLTVAAAPPQDGARTVEAAFAAARAVSPTPLRLDREREGWRLDRAREGADVTDADEHWAERWTTAAARDARVRSLAIAAEVCHAPASTSASATAPPRPAAI